MRHLRYKLDKPDFGEYGIALLVLLVAAVLEKHLRVLKVKYQNSECYLGEKVLPEWICLKCGHKWIDEGKVEPRYCPTCGSPTIYVPKIVKPK